MTAGRGERATWPIPELGLHAKAHRWWWAASLSLLVTLTAAFALGVIVPVPGLLGLQLTPLASLLAVMQGPLAAWTQRPVTTLEAVSVRPLSALSQIAVWLVPVAPALVMLALMPESLVYTRAVVASVGSTVAIFRLTGHSLSSLPVICWFIVNTQAGRELPHPEILSFFMVRGDHTSWLLPLLAATAAVMPGLERHRFQQLLVRESS